MKKFIALALIPLMASCANYCHKDKCQKQAEPAPLPVVYEEPEPMEEINTCACVNEPEPCREVKHPRIVEEMPAPEPRRVCDDHQLLDCGCGNCDTFHPTGAPELIYNPEFYEMPAPTAQTYVPAQPEGYTLAANRAFNRFIKETYPIYSQNPNIKLFVEQGVAKDADLPAGITSGVNTFKTQIINSHTFALVDSPLKADYVLKTTAEWFDTPSSEVPAIKYITTLVSKDGHEAGTWSQIVKRADNKSWL